MFQNRIFVNLEDNQSNLRTLHVFFCMKWKTDCSCYSDSAVMA